MTYPKRLIEVDLPIARISAHARREKSIRHGHISTLHIWWARRPLAACRAVICAALWPDPADPLCPPAFREAAARELTAFAGRVFPERLGEEGKLLASEKHLSPQSRGRWEAIAAGTCVLDPREEGDWGVMRLALLDFIADFANWDNSTVPAYLETSRALTQAAHEALGGAPGTRPLVVDPFAGGGSIPLEALRVGADAFASDLNPVAVLLNKVVLEYIPKHGQKLADEVRKWGRWVKEQAEAELAEFYPKDPDGATPIAYLWARTIRCEGPGCGAEVPLMRSLWLAKKAKRSVALRIVPNPAEKRVDFEILHDPKAKEVGEGTVARGSATCPCCGYTTPVASVRTQMQQRRGGADDARLLAVVATRPGQNGKVYRLPIEDDYRAVLGAAEELERRKKTWKGELSLVPEEPLPPQGTLGFRVQLYGMRQWCDLFTKRQLLTHTTFGRLVREAGERVALVEDTSLSEAVQVGLSCIASRCLDQTASLVVWHQTLEKVEHVFGRQAISMVWDFADRNPLSDIGWEGALEWVYRVLENNAIENYGVGSASVGTATHHPLPDNAVNAFVCDPPYYDAIPYSNISDFFYVWLRRNLPSASLVLMPQDLSPKGAECIVDESSGKSREYFEKTMAAAMTEGRRVLAPRGIGVVVFAHKSTSGWETQLQAMVDAGWTMTGSWPIDTEMSSRLRAHGSAALASSVHLVCRPREDANGEVTDSVGEWRDVLSELPGRLHEWMPRLAAEGVVGADAIFACLGPALEIFSRYSRVEKASGEEATLREYLEHVWAAVSTDALSVIFRDADAAGLEPDARMTAMWLWTLGAGAKGEGGGGKGDDEETGKVTASAGYSLEFDTARKIAQGLGVHLEKSESIVEVKGDKARLLPVSERTRYLFGKDTQAGPSGARKKKATQRSFFDELDATEAAEAGWSDLKGPPAGVTVLDRLHQAMILFAAGRGELMKRFLVEDGVGKDPRFWKLAQSLSALYPTGTDEKRWVDGVLARKKGLGL